MPLHRLQDAAAFILRGVDNGDNNSSKSGE